MYFTALADYYGFDVNAPYKRFAERYTQNIILYETGDTNIPIIMNAVTAAVNTVTPFEGVITNLERRYNANTYDYVRTTLNVTSMT